MFLCGIEHAVRRASNSFMKRESFPVRLMLIIFLTRLALEQYPLK